MLLVLTSLSVISQESVLLRVNYQKGDMYVLDLESKQDMGSQGGMDMKMSMNMIVEDIDGDNFKTESKISKIVMEMAQGLNIMSFDSRKKNEDLDETGKMLKKEFDPMMEAIIYSTINNLGKNIDVKIIPEIPGMSQMIKQSNSINFPEEKVSVGSTWSLKNETQGMKSNTVYKVLRIENGTVYLDVSGTVSGPGEGTIKGKVEIDISTGVQKKGDVEFTVLIGGNEIKANSKISIKKV